MKHFLFLLTLLLSVSLTAQVTYVNANATGNATGSDWENAYTELSEALEQTTSGDVWVAAGVYKPTNNTNRETSLHLNPNVNLYGGFPGTGNPDMSDRDWMNNPTILSGDLGILGDTSDNSHTVLRINATLNNAENNVNGFIITQGVADYNGGGIQISGAPFFSSTVNLTNCKFVDNFADYEGAAVDANSVALYIRDCIFEDNYSGYEGAGISDFKTTLFISNSIFQNNYADYEGAAISHFPEHYPVDDYELQIINTVFKNNRSGRQGAVIDTRGRVELFSCLFEGNSTDRDGGVFDLFQWGVLTATNCTFVNNEAGQEGSILSISSGIDTAQVSAHFRNSIFYENGGFGMIDRGNLVDEITFSHCLISTCPSDVSCDGTNLINVDPNFISDQDFQLSGSSPCIDAGQTDYHPVSITHDLAGNHRVTGGAIDMGAYEADKASPTGNTSRFGVYIYPNPASDYLILKNVVNPLKQASLFDANGRLVQQWKLVPTETNVLKINEMIAGVYYLKLSGSSREVSEKIIVQ